ncbi:MAG: single-strand binding protein, single-strand DNA-binding protein [Candidatus Peregrinibacteria bacterium GW2011_GWF2_39_17]|nr:MAG: single-strand binding protein, single-strand DNA-binding protein [Candidatus Peregrinibacteria bacterium GW2011_GWF2_39_17]HCW32729.1 single-stranded DNA-binding protein [Candidatus Peregrinibacteria bacterium]
MAMSLNRAQIIGNLTRDPEVRNTSNGRTVASFAVATNFRWTDATGQAQEKTEFHNVVVWGKLADICAQYLKKGSKAFVEGRLQTRDWTGEDGVKRYRTEIVADNMIMLDRRGEPIPGSYGMDREPAGMQSGQDAPAPDNFAVEGKGNSDQDDGKINVEDLPF